MKILIICGPTASGKTRFGIETARKLSGEIISADSRQVYRGMDVVTGKDLPENVQSSTSNVAWRDRKLAFYEIGGVRVWMYDVVNPNEPFNVAFWREGVEKVIAGISSRGKLPIIVGGTGLYIKSITHRLDGIDVPASMELREKLSVKTVEQLMTMLTRIDTVKAADMNVSDRNNPRRLIRAIEIALQRPKSKSQERAEERSMLMVGLTAPKDELYGRVDRRVDERIEEGAEKEIRRLISEGYSWNLPSMTAAGYGVWHEFLQGKETVSRVAQKWKQAERGYVGRQLTWFKKQADINWFDITVPTWKAEAENLITDWYI